MGLETRARAFNLLSDLKTYIPEDISYKICDFLDVEKQELSCNVTKKNNSDVWTYISNKEEIKKILADNKWDNFI